MLMSAHRILFALLAFGLAAAAQAAPPDAGSNPTPIRAAPAGGDEILAAPVTISGGEASTADEETAYHAAFESFKNGKYEDAIRAFQAQVQKWPDGRLAANAMYWAGQAAYIKGDLKTALACFQQVLQRPEGPKSADAMLKVGMLQFQLNDDPAARATLQRVVKTYPGTDSAQRAQQRLDAMH
ncbi:tol-pal system protein YbgF [Solimonas aquatica]|uniref:Tol-pal system protein YbgF n=1 Tax=Solimonas aquatica TaxID=489703 RepID=A0A1H9HH95_9GAMM|nr:tol-pal system protein YbgF [Solimonas aquatica]SEQ61668.1 tol-pal system protein YbgF [Solimonas aquatica]